MKKEAGKKNLLVLAAGTLVLFLTAGFTQAASPEGLSPAELRGQLIYRKGESPSSKPIITVVGGDTEIEAKLVPCGSCHGMDGRGRPEGSVVPPSIRWEDLTSPHWVSADGRDRVAYNEHLLVRAITMGFDSKDNRLHATMPRYALSRSDADDLIAYLKKLSTDHDPGISDNAIRIGALLPPASKYPDLAPAVQSALTAYFADLNKSGIYGRRIELLCRELPPELENVAPAFQDFLEKQQVFALMSSFMAGSEKQATAVLQEQKIPLVGAWTLLPETKQSPNSSVFYMDSGLPGQSETLAAFALREYAGAGGKLEIVVSDDELSHAAAAAVRSKVQGSPWATAEELNGPEDALDAEALVKRLATARTKVLFLALRGPQLVTLLHAIQQSRWDPVLLIPSALSTDPEELQPFSGRVFLAVSALPSDVTADGSAEYRKLASTYGLSRRHIAAQYVALAEAKILTEGLKRAGRDLVREHLVQSLEGLYDFPTGFSTSINFSPAKHIGITKFHIMTVDRATGSLTEVNRAQH